MKSFLSYIRSSIQEDIELVSDHPRTIKGINEMAQTIARAKQILGMLDRSTTDEEDRRIKNLSNREKRSNKILYGKGGRKMKKPPSVTRGDIFR